MRRKQRAEMRYIRRRTVTIPSDVSGSYTGKPLNEPSESDGGDMPVQDVDDL